MFAFHKIFIVNKIEEMIERTYLSKFSSIVKGSKINTGLNPVSELVYGRHTSRILCYFDHTKIKSMVEEGIFPNLDKLKHTLHITNAGSLDFTQLHTCDGSSIGNGLKKRATSFDLLFFLIPQEWDRGKGFDYSKTAFNENFYDTKNKHHGSRLVSTDGSNWFQAKNGYKWKENGVYSTETLSLEYDKFSSNEGSGIIIGRQHFDIGNENISLDITNVFNKFITSELKNYGIGIAFTPDFENISNEGAYTKQFDSEKIMENYVGFLTDKTNTFFEPYVETNYTDYISDDRANFIIDKNNKLYLYCTIGGKLTNLDKLPTCIVSGEVYNANSEYIKYSKEYEVHHHSTGVYYIDIKLSHSDFKADTMLFDTWSGIIHQGTELSPVELDFTLKSPSKWFNIGNSIEDEPTFSPSVFGIASNEVIKRGDIRKLGVITRVNYTNNQVQLISGIQARLYTKDGEREIDIIQWEPLNKTLTESYLVIDTNMLIPQNYYIDIKINYGMQSIIHHDMIHFKIVDDLNNKYV